MDIDNTVLLTKDDYTKCLIFILKLRYLWGGGIGDFRSSGIKRDIGKYIQDHMGGKLGEIAVQKFLRNNFDIKVKLDFEQYESAEDYSRCDIIGIYEKGGWRKPNAIVEVKDSKPSSRWELIPCNLKATEKCDYFIFVSVDMALDQLIRYFKPHLNFGGETELKSAIEDFTDIEADVLGIVSNDNLEDKSFFLKAGALLPEINLFAERERIPDRLRIRRATKSLTVDIKPLGRLTFFADRKFDAFCGAMTRKRQGRLIKMHETYLHVKHMTSLHNSMTGAYKLAPGIYKIDAPPLSPLREDNFAIPIRAIKSERKDWRQFIKGL